MQIAASPGINYISLDEMQKEVVENETRIESNKDILNKPDNIKENIVKGRVEKTLKNYTLLNQPCIRDQNITVEEFVKPCFFIR